MLVKHIHSLAFCSSEGEERRRREKEKREGEETRDGTSYNIQCMSLMVRRGSCSLDWMFIFLPPQPSSQLLYFFLPEWFTPWTSWISFRETFTRVDVGIIGRRERERGAEREKEMEKTSASRLVFFSHILFSKCSLFLPRTHISFFPHISSASLSRLQGNIWAYLHPSSVRRNSQK